MTAQPSGVVLVEEPDGYTRAVAPPGATFRWMLAACDDLSAATRHRAGLRILLDLSAVPRPGVAEQAMLGEHVARQLAHAEKVASLVADGEKTGYSERVARGLGLKLRVFTSAAEAVEWLKA